MTTEAVPTQVLTGIWTDLLGTPAGADDDFFDLGGYSLLVVEVVAAARAAGLRITAQQVFDHPTPRALATAVTEEPAVEEPETGDDPRRPDLVAHVWRTSGHPTAGPPTLVPLIPDGDGEPLFCVHTGTGVVRFFEPIARTLRAGRPVYGFEAIGYRARVRPYLSIAETAERYLAELRGVQPRGPYHLTGFCSGAVIAYEMARRLRQAGDEVAVLVLADPPSDLPEFDPGWGLGELYAHRLASLRAEEGLVDPVADLPPLLDRLRAVPNYYEPDVRQTDFYRLQVLWAATIFAQDHYEPAPYDGSVLLIGKTRHERKLREYWLPLLRDPEPHLLDVPKILDLVRHPLFAEVFAAALERR